MTRPASLVKVGVIAAAHGIRGQVKIRSLTEPPEQIFDCGALSDEQNNRQFHISKQGSSNALFIAAIENIFDRNEAEKLKGTALYAASEKVTLKLGDQLSGFPARLKNGEEYGEVTGVFNFGAGDVVEIKKTDGKTEMLPLTEFFITIHKDHVVVAPADYI